MLPKQRNQIQSKQREPNLSQLNETIRMQTRNVTAYLTFQPNASTLKEFLL